MNLTETIADLATGTYTVTRQAQAVPVKGRAGADGAASTLSFTGGVQPATGKDVDFFPEAVRQKEMKVIYTPVELLVARDGYLADVVSIAGADYQVVNSREWSDGVETIWVVYAAKVKLS